MEKLKKLFKERKKEVTIGIVIVLELLCVIFGTWALNSIGSSSNKEKKPVVVVQNQGKEEGKKPYKEDAEEEQETQGSNKKQNSSDKKEDKDKGQNQSAQDNQSNKDNNKENAGKDNEIENGGIGKHNHKGFKPVMMVGVSASATIEDYKNKVREVSEAGFEYMDLSLTSFNAECIWMQDGWEAYAAELKEYAEEQGVELVQSHLPDLNPLSKYSWKTTNSKLVIRSIEVCAALGIEDAVLHPGSNSKLTDKEAYFAALKEALEYLFPTMEEHNVNILLENTSRLFMVKKYNFYTGSSMKEFFDYLDHPLVYAVWDTGHANMEGHEYEDIIALGSYLKGLHVHNNNGNGDQHLHPLMGNMDLDGFMKGLVEINYQGYFGLEVDNYDNIDIDVCKAGIGGDPKFAKALQKMEELKDQPMKALYESVNEILKVYNLLQK